MRLEKLLRALPDDCDGALIFSPENRRYFTGFPSSDGVLLATRAGSAFLTDSRYFEAASRAVDCCEVLLLRDMNSDIAPLIDSFGCKRLALEEKRTTLFTARRVSETLPGIELLIGGEADSAIDSLRAVKDAGEVDLIKRAQAIAERAFEHILGFLREGVTEREAALELDFFMLKNGAEALSFETIVVGGENSSMPHGVPTSRALKRGDAVTMDFGAAVGGYHSDMTRTVFVGEISSNQAQVYDIVLRAQEAALASLRAGILLKDADAAARDIIAQAGYGDFFGHGTGHGVGIEIHEEPSLSPRSRGELAAGNIVTVEPGIYIPGSFGVRIEDMAFITEGGCENLTHAPKKPIIVGG